ncbi:MAG: hypothetical protein ACYTFV_01595 [Planctomycetota bacterium]|jgi:Tfp pilus assembly protein PilF
MLPSSARHRRFLHALSGLVLVLACVGLLTASAAPTAPQEEEGGSLVRALTLGETSLARGNLEGARKWARRALERDRRSIRAWRLYENWAEAAGDRDEQVWAAHKQLENSIYQNRPKREIDDLEDHLAVLDPLSRDLSTLRERYVDKLLKLADEYTADKRRHSAIRTHKEILALDPSRSESEAAIEELASAPDPSLAADAKPVDLFADVTDEWIDDHDERTKDWGDRAKLTRDNYVTQTNSGYEMMVRAAEAMEQMNAFYRVFFEYGTEEHAGGVPRIDLLIYDTRDEYLEIGGAIEWSRGFFNGSSVQTYAGGDSFETIVGVLFHEAAHQFVSLATNASGWLNEGVASFFEGTRILANGTVIMNLPANGRLFPLASRMERGFMEHVNDGIDPSDPNTTPEKAPTFAIVLSGRYAWGPPWYAPTWGVVYFCYNYQHPVDGRYVYRAAFRDFMDSLSSRLGDSAVEHFEEVILANPSAPTKGVPEASGGLALPETVEDLEPVWKDWILTLRDEQSGKVDVERPWFQWAQYAIQRKDYSVAFEQFEKALIDTPSDIDMLEGFAAFLADIRGEADRAAKLQLRAVQLLENEDPVDEKRLRSAKRKLSKYDPDRKDVEKIQAELRQAIIALVQRYYADGLYLQSMELAQRFGTELDEPSLFELYAKAIEVSGKDPTIWQLAYNETDLEGWVATGVEGWNPRGARLAAALGAYRPDSFDYRFLTYDTVTSGDYSFEAEVRVESGRGAFAGLVFGRKGATDFHALSLFPPKPDREEIAAVTAYADLTSFRGPDFKVWRHTPVRTEETDENAGLSRSEVWTKLRIDVVGTTVDAWLDGEFVSSQTFSNRDVLRGSFGLFLGPGEAQFRNVRYLARAANDPGSAIQRERRIEDLMSRGGGLNGSYLGYVPPFPTVDRWVQGEELDDWSDLGRRPVLYTMWDINSNTYIPIHEWLRSVESKWKDQGLRFISVVSPNDSETIEAYLEQNRFPGSIAVDDREGYSIGTTFETFSIDQFNLPRVLILDLDGRVVWEGDPGFSINAGWDPSVGSYVDEPLAELIKRRRLDELIPWLEWFDGEARGALADGRFGDVRERLEFASEFEARVDPAIADAQAVLGAVRAASSSLEAVADAVARDEADPALDVLIDWARDLGVEITGRDRKDLAPVRESRVAKHWGRTQDEFASWLKRNQRDPDAANPADLVAELRGLLGRFPRELADRIEADPTYATVEQLAAELPSIPAQWLAREYFRW